MSAKKIKNKKIQLSHGVALTNRFLHYNECGHCSLFWASPTHRLLLQQMCINVWLNVVQWIHKYANKFNSVYSCWSSFCYNTISVMHSIPNTQSWLTTFSWTSVFCGLQLNTFGNQMQAKQRVRENHVEERCSVPPAESETLLDQCWGYIRSLVASY